jgi:hypothetical protein
LEMIELPNRTVVGGEVPCSQTISGRGKREGLMDGPIGIGITPEGFMLVLERGNKRVQAFDIFGNPVPCFMEKSPFMELKDDGKNVSYLDIAVSPSGLIYILSYIDEGNSPSNYRLDIYNPEGGILSRTEGVYAARIEVDSWSCVYTLNFEPIKGADDRLEPSISEWVPYNDKI